MILPRRHKSMRLMRHRSSHDMDLDLLSKAMMVRGHLGLPNEVALPMEQIIEEASILERIIEEASMERITEVDRTLQARSRLSPLHNPSE